ncbi:hypothetical protein GIB67_006726 [Kingdonia uniflora]|uniref:Uncharacterized protein n=1 Tax=Kingdonia uniflora TaxID=39325 RepID=A0A7J7LYQ6_9MAGN|nr:hypothetical protein GIB67_006726 [Kingdonia uniflora]
MNVILHKGLILHNNFPNTRAETLDVAVSLAKIADVDRTLGDENVAVDEFQEAIKCLESLTLNANNTGLEQRRQSVLEFLRNQLKENQSSCA